MSEQTVQEGIRAVIQGITAFASADVTINDWSILSQPNENAPYAIISNADNFDSRQDARSPATRWQEVVTLYERFTDWNTTWNNFRTRRQALIDEFNAVGDNRSANGLTATTIEAIRSSGPISPYYDPGLSDQQLLAALPLYIYQNMIFECLEF